MILCENLCTGGYRGGKIEEGEEEDEGEVAKEKERMLEKEPEAREVKARKE